MISASTSIFSPSGNNSKFSITCFASAVTILHSTYNPTMRRFAFAIVFVATTAFGRVEHIDVGSRTDYLGGKTFGFAGAYERIQGRAYFALDPANAHDRVIVDLDKAPRNAK